MSRLLNSPPALDLTDASPPAATTTTAAASSCGVDAQSLLRLLLVQRVDLLSAKVRDLEKQLRFANATIFSMAEGHILKDQRIAELEAASGEA